MGMVQCPSHPSFNSFSIEMMNLHNKLTVVAENKNDDNNGNHLFIASPVQNKTLNNTFEILFSFFKNYFYLMKVFSTLGKITGADKSLFHLNLSGG